jgi:rare lipoprotein A
MKKTIATIEVPLQAAHRRGTQGTSAAARCLFTAVLAAGLALPAARWEGETGMASWYGYPYHGRFAASGELYDMEEMTAAHPTLPFNTLVRVVNLGNDRSVDVRITDRGPFVDGRIIDLSRAAARTLGLLEAGTARVRVELVGINQPAVEPTVAVAFAVQTGAFRSQANAERYCGLMRVRYGSARILPIDSNSGIWRVLAGPESTREEAHALSERIRQDSGENNAFVVQLDSDHDPVRPEQSSRPRGTVATDGLHSTPD